MNVRYGDHDVSQYFESDFSPVRRDFLLKLLKEKRIPSDMFLLSREEFNLRLDAMMQEEAKKNA